MRNDLGDVDRVVLSMKASVQGALGASSLVKFEISLSEALTNLVKHARTSDRSAPIDIELDETDTSVRVEMFDPVGAQPFDLRDHARPLASVDPLAESGRGLGLFLQCSDDVDYGPKADRMCLSLSFSKSGD
ncbi:ATP-binding protein [Sulfitobacter sp. S190]|uniref:ATP-binding protein n=1 Tax=Sulfitobacter sp. S190 TaxID=2867022 RepID=UPI0021A7195D|nr:ATP-binding protein [Sulfitobacter sp. S190]UWR22009.1 ATP-binding protein [Sulfitobacter sp. S190]